MPNRLLSVACLVSIAISGSASAADQRPRHNLQSAKSTFAPRPYISRVENYVYDSSSKSNHQQGENDSQDSAQDAIDSSPTEPLTSLESSTGEVRRTLWSRVNDLDKEILKTTLPIALVFAITPIAMSTNLFWVNRLGNTLAVAGQSAANQVYSSLFWLFSFLPMVTATLVSKSYASGEQEATTDAVCQAMQFAIIISLVGTPLMFLKPTRFLRSILKGKLNQVGEMIPS